MTKHLMAIVAATSLWAPQAAGQSILQNTDWQGSRFETHLPAPQPAVPWLNLDPRTKLPKGDLPIGREAATIGPLVLRPVAPDTQVSANVPADFRRM